MRENDSERLSDSHKFLIIIFEIKNFDSMKKIILILASVLIGITYCFAQKCSTSWPYLYEEFGHGELYFSNGSIVHLDMNVHLAKGTMHYVDENNIIREPDKKNLLFAKINNEKFMIVSGCVMKVVAEKDNGFIAAYYTADFQASNESGGAYGASSNSSATTKLTSINVPGVNQNIMNLKREKSSGTVVPIKTKYYIITLGKVIEADKKEVEANMSEEKLSGFKAFIKKNRIRWKDPSSLTLIIDYLNS